MQELNYFGGMPALR